MSVNDGCVKFAYGATKLQEQGFITFIVAYSSTVRYWLLCPTVLWFRTLPVCYTLI